MIVKTNLKPRDYSTREVVRIVNPKQREMYIKHGVYPIDLYMSVDVETNKNILVVVFLRSETTEVYEKWKNYELE